MLIEKLKEKYKVGEPIFIEDILLLFPEYTRAYVFRLIKRAEANGEIYKFSRGVYYLPKESFFGFSTLTPSMVANNKYVSDGEEVYGIYSGQTLLNQFALSSQVPNIVEIITNNEATRKRVVDIEGMKFILRRSRFDINKDNYRYYALLELFLELGFNPNMEEFEKQLIKNYMKENDIDQKKLIKYGMEFPAQALKNLIGCEVIDSESLC